MTVQNILGAAYIKSVNRINFITSGTWTPPANLASAIIFMQAAGGGGSGARNTDLKGNIGSPGGAGCYGQVTLQASAIAGPVTVTVGANGSGGAAGSGSGDAGTAGGNCTITDGVFTYTVGGGGASGLGKDIDFGGISNTHAAPAANVGAFDWVIVPPQGSTYSTCAATANLVIAPVLFAHLPYAIGRASGASINNVQSNTSAVFGGGGAGATISLGSASIAGGDGGSGLVRITEFLL